MSVGGHIESDVSIEDAIVRETREELGLDISHVTDEIQYLLDALLIYTIDTSKANLYTLDF